MHRPTVCTVMTILNVIAYIYDNFCRHCIDFSDSVIQSGYRKFLLTDETQLKFFEDLQ